jgi:hypothetical protein
LRQVEIYPDGTRIEGEFLNGQLVGQGVRSSGPASTPAGLARGTKYEGEMKDGLPHGRGVLVDTAGDRYCYSYYQTARDIYLTVQVRRRVQGGKATR